MLVVSVFFIYKFFSSRQSASKIVNTDTTISIPINQSQSEPKLSTIWRIAGELTQNGKSYVILLSNSGAIKLEPASNFSYSGMMKQGIIDNEIVTRFSGRTAQ